MPNPQNLDQFRANAYHTPDGYTSDIAVFSITSEYKKAYTPPKMTLKIMLIKRAAQDREGNRNVEANKWALPGGFVHPKETAFDAAKRELEEETGISGIHLKHFNVYDKPGRDPRGWIISNAHYAIVAERHLIDRNADDDASDVALYSLEELSEIELAFDHNIIIKDAIKQITYDILHTTVAKNFLPNKFTYSELQAVLLTVSDDPAIKSDQAFARKIKTLPFIEEVEQETTTRTSKKPTKLYRFINVDIHKPIYTARY